MADITIPWGDQTLSAPLPPHWAVQQIAEPTISLAGGDWLEHLAAALTRPEGTPPLAKMLAARRTGRIAVIFRELAYAEVPNENVEIIFATGMHPPLTVEQATGKIGEELASSVRWRSNPWARTDAYTHVGSVHDGPAAVDVWIDRRVVEADLRIVVTSVSPHLQAGFGGGGKMFLPGCARLDSVRQMHLAGVPRRARQMVGQPHTDNRMRRLVDSATAAVDAHHGRTFGVQYLLDADDRLAALATGDLISCQQMLAKRCAAGCGVVIDSPADVVIVNAYPRDFDLWQSFKAIANTCWAVRDNGVLICLARCPGGAQMPTLSLPIGPRWVRRAVRLMGADALGSLLTRTVPRLAGDAAFFVRLALQVIQRVAVVMGSPALAEAGTQMLGLDLLADPAEAFQAAEDMLGGGPKRVIVFPSGGITYPVLRR